MIENLENNLEQPVEQTENQVQQEESVVENDVQVEMKETAQVAEKKSRAKAEKTVAEEVVVSSGLESDPAFDWEKFEEGDYQSEFKKTDLEKMYNDTLSAVKVNEW